ncbi:MAG: SpoIID/LytB domain-containing protein, partial [Nitrospiraceae bacterium]
DFEVRRDNLGLHFIITLPLERYTAGVIAAEIGEDWAMEALKAQAVISRTYALYQKIHAGREDYHITSSILHQVYRGDTDDDRIQRAVVETGGEVLTFKGELIKSFYHATCTGNTELPGEVWGESYPYLQSVPCRGENAPYEQWQRKFQRSEIEKALGLKGIRDMYISSYTATGRVDQLTVVTGAAVEEVKAVALRRLLGYKALPSTDFSINSENGEVIFAGGGYGHGVGLSQWGSLALAHEGKTYREILSHYYPGTVLINSKETQYQVVQSRQ